MKKHLMTIVLALSVGVLGFAVSGIAVAANGKPPSPPGQGDCEHGNNGAACKDDPSDNGKDCEAHGNNGGVNEDHCKGDETTPTETTPTETTPSETTPAETTPTETTPTETTPTQTTPSSSSSTPPATVPQETTPVESTPPESTPVDTTTPPSIVGTPPKAQHAPAVKATKTAVLGVSSKSPKPTRQPQAPPFTL